MMTDDPPIVIPPTASASAPREESAPPPTQCSPHAAPPSSGNAPTQHMTHVGGAMPEPPANHADESAEPPRSQADDDGEEEDEDGEEGGDQSNYDSESDTSEPAHDGAPPMMRELLPTKPDWSKYDPSFLGEHIDKLERGMLRQREKSREVEMDFKRKGYRQDAQIKFLEMAVQGWSCVDRDRRSEVRRAEDKCNEALVKLERLQTDMTNLRQQKFQPGGVDFIMMRDAMYLAQNRLEQKERECGDLHRNFACKTKETVTKHREMQAAQKREQDALADVRAERRIQNQLREEIERLINQLSTASERIGQLAAIAQSRATFLYGLKKAVVDGRWEHAKGIINGYPLAVEPPHDEQYVGVGGQQP